ncbi:MAG: regulatory protein RecX [Rhodospirillaceae bacterium]|nr:regulatory protein RecX [Rhodospirillaceae bacterium]
MSAGKSKPASAGPAVEAYHAAALGYLERFASSADNMRRVLQRRAYRDARRAGTDVDLEQVRPVIDAVIARLERAGLIDDASYAEIRAGSLNRRGESGRRIRARLRAKGVATSTIDQAIEGLKEEDGDPEFRAACRLARRRRLGPARPAAGRAALREKDMAALARAGFNYETVRRVIALADAEALDTAIAAASPDGSENGSDRR